MRAYKKVTVSEGQPCNHTGCSLHISHPCEVCGRIAMRGTAEYDPTIDIRIRHKIGASLRTINKFTRKRM